MSKKNAFAPYIFLGPMDPPGPTSDVGDNSDWGGVDPNPNSGNYVGPMTYADWLKSIGGENGSFEAYGQWWADNGYDLDAWRAYNPNVTFVWDPEDDA